MEMTLDSDPRLLLAILAATNATIVAILGAQIIAVWMRAQDLLITFYQTVLHARDAAKRGKHIAAGLRAELGQPPEGARNTVPPSAARNEAMARTQDLITEFDEESHLSNLIEPDVNEMYRLSLMGLGIMGSMAVAGVMLPLIAIATEHTDPVVLGGVTWITLTGIWAVVVYVWRTVIGSWDLKPSEAMRKVVQEDTADEAAVRTSRRRDYVAAGALAVGALVLFALLLLL